MSLLIFFTTLVAWFFQSLTGFGAGIFIVGFLSLFINPKVVVINSAFVNLLGTLLSAYLYSKKGKPDLRELLFLGFGSAVGIALGSKALTLTDEETLRKLIGVFITVLGLYDYLVQRGSLNFMALRKGPPFGLGMGFIGGFFAGLIGIGGPPPVVYLNQVIKDVNSFKATLSLLFTLNIIFRIASYKLMGGEKFFDLNFVAPSLLSIPLGIVLGFYLSQRIRPQRIKRFVSISIVILGLSLL